MSGVHRRRRLGRGRGSDRGFTLPELLVVIVLLGIIGGIVGTVVRIGLTHQAQMQDRNGAFADARKVIQRVDRDIRSAYLGSGTSSTTLVLDEYENGLSAPPTIVTYTVSPVTSTRSELSYQACATCTSQVLITNLVQTSTTPVFKFTASVSYSTNQPAAQVGSVNATDCSTTSATDPLYESCVGIIIVHLMVQPPTINQPVDVTDSGTELRNTT